MSLEHGTPNMPKMVDGKTDLDEKYFNLIHGRVDQRLAALEELRVSWESATDTLTRQGLARIDEVLAPAFQKIEDVLELGFMTASSSTSNSLVLNDELVFIVDEGARRELFTPTEFLAITRVATIADYALARRLAYNPTTGALTVGIISVAGNPGPHTDWEIGGLAAATVAQQSALETVETLAGQVTADKATVAADKGTVAADKATAALHKDAAAASATSANSSKNSAAASAEVAASAASQALNVLDRVDVPASLYYDFTDVNGAPFKGKLIRATNGGMRLTSRGLLASTAINEPVIDFGADGKPKGTRFFGAYTNLLTYSEQFDNAAWAKQRTTVTADATVAPDGVSSADKIIESVAAGSSYVAQSHTFAAAIYTWSVFARAGEKTRLDIYLVDSGGGTANARVTVNLATGAITGGTGIILALPNGWYLIMGTTAANMVAGVGSFRIQLAGTELDDGTSGLYLWGAQLTQTTFPVPYVPTTSAAVVRNADSFILSGTDFTDFYNQNEGTYFCEFMVPPVVGSSEVIVGSTSGTINSSFYLTLHTDNTIRVGANFDWGANIVGPVNTGVLQRVAFSYIAGLAQLSVNGGSVITDPSLTPQVQTSMAIGRAPWVAGNYANGHIKRLIYWPKAFDATTLQRMTA